MQIKHAINESEKALFHVAENDENGVRQPEFCTLFFEDRPVKAPRAHAVARWVLLGIIIPALQKGPKTGHFSRFCKIAKNATLGRLSRRALGRGTSCERRRHGVATEDAASPRSGSEFG